MRTSTGQGKSTSIQIYVLLFPHPHCGHLRGTSQVRGIPTQGQDCLGVRSNSPRLHEGGPFGMNTNNGVFAFEWTFVLYGRRSLVLRVCIVQAAR